LKNRKEENVKKHRQHKHGKIDMLIGKVLLEEIMQARLELVVENLDKGQLAVV
jgi:hypothetical protein